MSTHSSGIKDLFRKLSVAYGRRFSENIIAGNPIETVASEWESELKGFSDSDVREAVTMLKTSYKEYPPTLYQFIDLCASARRRRTSSVKKVESTTSRVDPKEVRSMIQRWINKVNITPK